MTVSIDPKIWGSSAWKLLHDISFYVASIQSEQDQIEVLKKAHEFFTTLRYVLPCETCQFSLDIHLVHLPFPSKSDDLPRWVFDLHNRVNETLTRKIPSPPKWEKWVITYPTEMTEHQLRDIWPFIQSVVEVHPGKETKGFEVYKKNLHIFFTHVWEFLYDMKNAYLTDKEILKNIITFTNSQEYDDMIQSKSNLRKWVTSIGKQIHSPLYSSKLEHCKKTCHV